MARPKLRSQTEVVDRCRALQGEVRAGLQHTAGGSDDPAATSAVWRGEALGTLLWALELAELPPYDHPFDSAAVAGTDLAGAQLRDPEDVDLERQSARLWHWRARTTALEAKGEVELPPPYAGFDQLIAATAMRGFEQELLPAPMRGDFPAYGKVYRHLSAGQLAEAHAIAAERHHALNWLCGLGSTWDDVPLDT
ncbi:MAG TPA: hypothetical protein VF094_11275 [Gaiellaceae bacterium]